MTRTVLLLAAITAALTVAGAAAARPAAAAPCAFSNVTISQSGQGAQASFTISEGCPPLFVTLFGVSYAANPNGTVYSEATQILGPGNHTLGSVALPCGVGSEADLAQATSQTIGAPMDFPPAPFDHGSVAFRLDCPPTPPPSPAPPTPAPPAPAPPVPAPVPAPASVLSPPPNGFFCVTKPGEGPNGQTYQAGDSVQIENSTSALAEWATLGLVPAPADAAQFGCQHAQQAPPPAASPPPASPPSSPPAKAHLIPPATHTVTTKIVRECWTGKAWVKGLVAACKRVRLVRVPGPPAKPRALPKPRVVIHYRAAKPTSPRVIRVKVRVSVRVPGPTKFVCLDRNGNERFVPAAQVQRVCSAAKQSHGGNG